VAKFPFTGNPHKSRVSLTSDSHKNRVSVTSKPSDKTEGD